MSIDPETALAEYRQGATISPPGTLVAYRVDVTGVVNFAAGYDPAIWPDTWADAGCNWKYISRIERRDPPSWRIGDYLTRNGARGLLFPSARHLGGTNLVLFSANLGADDHVVPHDPEGKRREFPSVDAGAVSDVVEKLGGVVSDLFNES